MPNEPDEQFMQQRLLIASVLSAVALMVYMYVQGPPPPTTDAPAKTEIEQQVTEQSPSTPKDVLEDADSGAAKKPSVPETSPDEAASADVKAAASETESIVETNAFKIRFSNKGAVVKSWVLKEYQNAERTGELELVHQRGAIDHGYPFEIDLPGGEPLKELNNALFVVSEEPASGDSGPAIVFEYSKGSLHARKAFRFQKEDYILHVESEVTKDGVPQEHMLTWKGGFGDTAQTRDARNSATYYYDPAEGSIKRNTASSADDERLINTGAYSFAGISDLFFTACFLSPEDVTEVRLETSAVSIAPSEGTAEETFATLDIGAPGRNEFDVFIGPKSIDVLGAIRPELKEIVDFGRIWGFIAEPIFWMLRWTHHNVVANYGWSIILVAVFLNFATFPLKWKSMKSMKKMQALQPLVKEINDRYKGLSMRDPKKQQQQEEMMELYKKHGVNPLGGCLPMLLQLPFYIGFYNVLSVAIETRHSEWLWVADLSMHEFTTIRYLPIAMVLSQFWQQSMSPPTPSADPSQMRIMKFMPLMMGIFFWSFPSGLMLFWLTGNLVGVLQQVLLNRFSSEDVAIEVPRGRRKKKSKPRGQ